MTTLTKPVRREVQTAHGTTLIVTLDLLGVSFREKGTNKSFLLPYGAGYIDAVTRHVDAERRAEKAAKRGGR